MTLLRDVEVDGRRTDVRLDRGMVSELGLLTPADEEVVDCRGGALLPGLHDHHLHLLALAARDASVDVGGGLDALNGGSGDGWLRGVGWSGDGDRLDLDAVIRDRPIRVQHRSGALWVVNTAGAAALGLDGVTFSGVERDRGGTPTGRLWRMDGWLSERLGRVAPDLAAVGRRLAALGITGVTDATPDLDRETCELLSTCLPQHVQLLGDPDGLGPVKLVLSDHDLPTLDDLVERLLAVRPRAVAVHSVTRESYLLLVTALDIVGRHQGDRVEHGSLLPLDLLPDCPVVTQPAFLFDKGEDYLKHVPAQDLPDLYRYASLPWVVPSSDAPYGPLDPWQVLRAARDRATATGRVINPHESVSVSVALSGMLRPLEDLRAPSRQVVVGVPADLVLLHVPLADLLEDPQAELVRSTWVRGTPLTA
jgi:predicted amidohydrolase YtcJ